VSYHDNGKEYLIQYFINDKLHREDGPAYVEYRDDGSLITKQWYRDGKLHNEPYYPAIISVTDGLFIHAEFWTDGELISKCNFSNLEIMEVNLINEQLKEHYIHIMLDVDDNNNTLYVIDDGVTKTRIEKKDLEQTIYELLGNS
jgi:hypothetical protein